MILKRLILFASIVILTTQSMPAIIYFPSIETLLKSSSGKPRFIDHIDDDSRITNTPPDICMYVREYDIWEAINNGSDVYNSIQNTKNVIIDGNITPPVMAISDLNLIAHCFNDDLRNCVGSHGGATGICFGVGNIEVGQHIAYVEFQSTAGKRFSHMWVFEVKTDGIVPEVTATPP